MRDAAVGGEHVAESLLLEPATRVTCPKCEHEFSLEQGFARKSLEQLASASEDALAGVRQSVAASVEARLAREAAERELQSKSELESLRKLLKERDEQHANALREMLAERDERLKALLAQQQELARRAQGLELKEQALQDEIAREAKAQAQQLAAQARAQLEEELTEKARQISELQGQELELRRERARLEDSRQALELETQRKLDEQRREIEERVRTGETERSRMKEAELQKTIDDMRAKLEEAQRKSEQGSQQLQGEVLELILEEQLATEFPLDSIAEVKKGVRGGDAVHTVMTRSGQRAGVILWEAKRTAKWGNPWPAKLKDDMRATGAEVGVIITTSFPPDWPQGQLFGLHEDVWVTTPAAAIPLAAALRAGLLDAYKARVASANKGEKMEAVYDYLTSPQFAQKLRAVYDAFRKMRAELETERTTTMQRWNRREKQIQMATMQLIGIAGDLQGLAQQDLPQLELEAEVKVLTTDGDMDAGI
jgi:hypothetical protein